MMAQQQMTIMEAAIPVSGVMLRKHFILLAGFRASGLILSSNPSMS